MYNLILIVVFNVKNNVYSKANADCLYSMLQVKSIPILSKIVLHVMYV